ncbi:quinone-dependent dihydroorotate dehydrogenase [Mesorhizobium sp. J18]|uniref:quinone-dependent dihydroorotate dehydrogenase n=1 Tax=Mesorhizobium sp. J18 TaxID=935263 RepID=UPI0011A1A412|nr:quinone-dependent dihydroorotate dehydrogenase [Mesorhizobium sp. J18]
MRLFDAAARGVLFSFDPETAHGLSIAALKTGFPVCRPPRPSTRLATTVAGIAFPNPIGMAAGYDKNGEVPDALLALGFGFAECGTVTPLPQPGNPRPRIFRLEAHEGVINRLGFNNEGNQPCLERLKARNGRPGIVGVNIGANKDSADRIADYEAGVRTFAGIASYLTVNISSPNTAGLRNLQDRDNLSELLNRVVAARSETGAQVPIFLKIAPDLDDEALGDIARIVKEYRLDGLIVSNTTLSRHNVSGPYAQEAGGLSGRPLFEQSTIMLARMRLLAGPDLPLIGVGGVNSAETALEKIRAGADLVQLYTGMIYAGPSLPGRILRGMEAFMRTERIENLRQIRDSRAGFWAERKAD